MSDSVTFSGIVIDGRTNEGLSDVHCRYGRTRGVVSDEQGRFRLRTQRGDSVVFTYVGFKPCVVVIPDSLYEHEYILGVFMTPDTLLLSEAFILRRGHDAWRQNMINLRNNMSGILNQAFAPVKNMDAVQNQQMMINQQARAIEMKGHVDVSFWSGHTVVGCLAFAKIEEKIG